MSNPKPGGALTGTLERIRQELDTVLESVWSGSEKALDAVGLKMGTQSLAPPVDILEEAERITVFVDLPGVNSENVDVSLSGNMLTIRGLRTPPTIGELDRWQLTARARGTFTRTIPLPASVNADQVTAVTQHGVLAIHLPKRQPEPIRQIKVDTAS